MTKKICTHNGPFHADDAVGVAILTDVLAAGGNGVSVTRTRDPKVMETADYVLDVGGAYDAERGRFDHHQEGRAGARDNGVLYSSAGLVWKHHGIDYLRAATPDYYYNDEDLMDLWGRIDSRFIAAIDASDNGQELMSGGSPNFPGVKGVSFSAVIGGMNPTWMETSKHDDAFRDAVRLASSTLRRAVAEAEAHIEARDTVLDALGATGDSPVLVLPRFVPWTEHLHESGSEVLYVVFPDTTGNWMVQCVPTSAHSFEKRKPLPAAWAGKRDADFQNMTQVEDGVFCHPGLFICGAQSRDGALRLAAQAAAA